MRKREAKSKALVQLARKILGERKQRKELRVKT